jgi:hypothetical protein
MVKQIPKPIGWNELPLYAKIQVYAMNLTEEHSQYVDKLHAKQIVKDRLGNQIHVARVVRVLESCEDLRPEDLQPNHIIKSSHASGWNINVMERIDYQYALSLLRVWNQLYHPYTERQYSFLKPTFFVEEKIEDCVLGNTWQCLTYMFRYIHGELISIGVCHNERGVNKCNHYDLSWNLTLPPEIGFAIPCPKKLQDLVTMSNILAQGFEFVRIDFFVDKDDNVFFSEFTLTPKAGKPTFPLHLEKEYGKLWI